jgi:uncharacterized protein
MPERRTAVITGASSGIGAMFARRLAARGYDLLLIARREDRLRSLAAELHDLHHISAEIISADLASDTDLERVAGIVRVHPSLALLVNNAGFGSMGYFFDAPIESQDRMHRLHVLATMRLSHAALANMVPRGAGGVINVASVAGFMQSPQNVSYCSTKAWMISFTEGLAIELASLQSAVKAQALCPGFTLSEFHDTLGMDRSPIPKSLWMTAEFVVEESLKAQDRGEVIVIPGWRYKMVVAGLKILPAGLKRKIFAGGASRYRRPNPK